MGCVRDVENADQMHKATIRLRSSEHQHRIPLSYSTLALHNGLQDRNADMGPHAQFNSKAGQICSIFSAVFSSMLNFMVTSVCRRFCGENAAIHQR